jgi:hypothetical protein
MRLVFEEGLFGYKFLALAVMLILLDLVQGRLRGQTLAWLALVTLAFKPFRVYYYSTGWLYDLGIALPLAAVAVVLVVIVRDAFHKKIRWYLIPWLAVVVWAFIRWPPYRPHGLLIPLPLWYWQVILVGSGLVMAAGPFAKTMMEARRARRAPTPDPEGVPQRADEIRTSS